MVQTSPIQSQSPHAHIHTFTDWLWLNICIFIVCIIATNDCYSQAVHRVSNPNFFYQSASSTFVTESNALKHFSKHSYLGKNHKRITSRLVMTGAPWRANISMLA